MHACVRTCLRLFETNCLPRSHWHARSAYAYVYVYIYIYIVQFRCARIIKLNQEWGREREGAWEGGRERAL